MNSYSCLIVDDNEIERDAIEMQLRKISRLEIVASCCDGIEAASILLNQPIDIVFSDIDMPGLSGTGLLKSNQNPPLFIFITSFAHYAIEGFNLDALDFIVKPATFERLLKATTKAISYLDLKKSIDTNHIAPTPTNDENYFYVKETKGFTRLNYQDAIYIESMGDFSRIFTATNNHVTLVSLKNLTHQLPAFFLRVHKQFIINLNQINMITASDVILNDGFKVPISLTHRQELIDKISNKTISRHLK